MKKIFHRISIFAIFPIILLLVDLGEKNEVLAEEYVMYLGIALILLASAVIGNFSPSRKIFDIGGAIAVALSLCVALFVMLIFDEGCDGGAQLSIAHALNLQYYKAWLPIICAAAVIAFLASFKPIKHEQRKKRKSKKDNKKNKNKK